MIVFTDAVECVRDIVRSAGITPARLYFFGSRTRGEAHRGSDLDVAIDAVRAVTLSEMARLKEALDDSALPYRVDVSDFQQLDLSFRERALAGAVVAVID